MNAMLVLVKCVTLIHDARTARARSSAPAIPAFARRANTAQVKPAKCVFIYATKIEAPLPHHVRSCFRRERVRAWRDVHALVSEHLRLLPVQLRAGLRAGG